jgi:hypothetical protein
VTEPNEFDEFRRHQERQVRRWRMATRVIDGLIGARARRDRNLGPEDDFLLEPNVAPDSLGHFLSHIAARTTRTL